MCDGMVAAATAGPPAGTATHRLATVLLLPLLFLGATPGSHASGCPRPGTVEHGWGNLTETNRGSLLPGTVVQYGCQPGYALDGHATINCTSAGLWSSDPPLCIKITVCQSPSEPDNGGYRCHPSPCKALAHGTVIEYFCAEGYVRKGEYNYRTCRNGEWTPAMQTSCHLGQGKEEHSALAMPALSVVASTASSVALVLLLLVLFVLLQPKLKSFHHSRREQGVSGQPPSIVVEGIQVSLPSYEEAVYGSTGGATAAPPPESRVQIVLSEGPQAEGAQGPEEGQVEHSLPSTSSSCRQAETVLVHQAPSTSSPTSSSSSWAAEQPAVRGPFPLRQDSDSSDQHSLLSVTSAEDYGDDIPLLKEA